MFIMVTIWGVTIFNFYLILYLLNTFDQVYTISLMVCFADILGYMIAGILIRKFGVKRTF